MIGQKQNQESSIRNIKVSRSSDKRFVHVSYDIDRDTFGYSVRIEVARAIAQLIKKVEGIRDDIDRTGLA
jgi:hypothetical protein